MIRYSLKCNAGHGFESWFQNAAAFATLLAAGELACPICGRREVDKDLMAPHLRTAQTTVVDASVERTAPGLSEPGSDLEKAIAALRRQIAETSEYVGLNFASEARRIHDGEAPERAIYGEARADDARKLIEDGLPVAPLPFLPTRKVN